ncbi:MAG: phage tail tape measure protein [Muribaculaceae bacterium]|nr:phage tail tape measure protein [Muribaculaceae bacterium]
MASGKNKSMITFGVKIEDGKDGFKMLTMSAEALQKVLAATVTESEKLNKKFINLSAIANSANQVKNAISEIGGVLQSLSGDSLQFAAAMKATNTMAGEDAAGFGELKDQVTDLAKSIPLAREELANGLYQVISNGVPEDNWIEFLNASSRSAVGGIADLRTAVTVTSTIIKNYGLEWDKAREIQDKIQLTAKNGVTSFEQLASSLPKVTEMLPRLELA